MSFSMFLFMTSFNLIMPELNQFITALGGEEYKGLVISLFTISAGISRPFSGKLADTIGRKPVALIGIFVCFATCLFYPLVYSVWLFLVLRFIHGFSAGFTPTGATALITDLLPADRRGKGMGIWGTFISVGIGVGQSLGSYVYQLAGMNSLFLFAAFVAVLAGILLQFVKETVPEKIPFSPSLLRLKPDEIIDPSVLPSATVMFLTAGCSGIIFVLTPDLSGFLGIQNKGWFFGIYVIATIVVRLFSGSLSDRIGRRETLIIGVTLLIVSMFLIGYAKNTTDYLISALLFGVATGVTSPTIFAWTADLSDINRRGVGAGTMFIALEFGIMAGSLSTLLVYENTLESITNGFLIGVALAFSALIFLIVHLIRFR